MSARERVAGQVANYVDERTGSAKWLKKTLTKVFPDHWSFMLGEIVLYSFVILLLSGTFLTSGMTHQCAKLSMKVLINRSLD